MYVATSIHRRSHSKEWMLYDTVIALLLASSTSHMVVSLQLLHYKSALVASVAPDGLKLAVWQHAIKHALPEPLAAWHAGLQGHMG